MGTFAQNHHSLSAFTSTWWWKCCCGAALQGKLVGGTTAICALFHMFVFYLNRIALTGWDILVWRFRPIGQSFLRLWAMYIYIYTGMVEFYKVNSPTNVLFIKLDKILKFTLKITLNCSYVFRSAVIIIIIIIIIFINCNWVVTRWQYTLTHKNNIEQHN